MMIAVQTGHTELCEVLMAAGADVNAREKIDGTSVLMKAAKKREMDIVEVLVQGEGKNSYLEIFLVS